MAVAAGVLAARRLRMGVIALAAMLDTLATSPEPTPIVDEGLVEEEAQCAQIRAYRESLGV